MILYLKKVCELIKKFVRVQVRYVPRAKNSQVDALAKLATTMQEELDRWISVEHLLEPLININIVTIRTIKAALKTKLENLKGKWEEYLPKVLWEYRTTHKSATRETPLALAFGTEAVAPVEVGLKSPRVEFTNAEHNEGSLHLNLDLLEEKREHALKGAKDYQRKTAMYYD